MSFQFNYRVEFLIAYTDHTWDTVEQEFNVPQDVLEKSESELDNWLTDNFDEELVSDEYALVAVYYREFLSIDDDDDSDEEA